MYLSTQTKRILIFLTLYGGIQYCVQAAVITGYIGNDIPESRMLVQAPHYYLDGKADKYPVQLDDTRHFQVELSLQEPQIVFFAVNNDRLPLFLAPNDTVDLRTSLVQFPLNVQFAGKGGSNNRLLQEYLRLANKDFSDFNNTRFKVGLSWLSVESGIQSYMDKLRPEPFRMAIDEQRSQQTAFLDAYRSEHPDALTPEFSTWIEADIEYSWAYSLLLYGQVNERFYNIPASYFEFTNNVSSICNCLDNEAYRNYLNLLMARQMVKTGNIDAFYAKQYELAGQFIDGKPLAYLRSELIYQAFNTDRYREILPVYLDFLKTNTYPAFEPKVTDLYAKVARNAPGSQAPTFAGTEADGQRINLVQYRNKIVYLNFWASWCSACLEKMAYLDQFVGEFYEKGIEVIHVSIDADAEKWQNAIQQRAFRGHHVLSTATNAIAKSYGVEAIPQYFIIGKDGNFADKPIQHQAIDIRNHLLSLSKTR
jgi:peroxiredoxin